MSSKHLSLSISPCPNDTFMMDAIINRKIDLRGYQFELSFADIDVLNSRAIDGSSDISKISCAVLPKLIGSYNVLPSGSALGVGNAPLLVSRRKIYPDEIEHCKIAIPGELTTAALLLRYSFPRVKELKTYLFSDIAEAIISDEVDAGVLIHEERFVYQKKSLRLIADLADKWHNDMKLPIPLGLIAIKEHVDPVIKSDISSLIRESIEFAFANPRSSYNFVKQHAQLLSEDVIESHINMFVNNYSLDMGVDGQNAVMKMMEVAGVSDIDNKIFV